MKLLSQELRFTSPDDRDAALDRRRVLHQHEARPARRSATSSFPASPPIPFIANDESNDNDAYSVFAQVDYDFTDRTTLGVSLRYDRDEREQTDVSDPSGADAQHQSFDEVQPRVVLDHKLTDDQLGYVSYGTGFRSGGFNGIGGRPFDAETLQNYEIGYKSDVARRPPAPERSRLPLEQRRLPVLLRRLQRRAARRSSTTSKGRVHRRGARSAGAGHARLDALRLARPARLGHQGVRSDTLTVPARAGNRTPKTQKSSLSVGSRSTSFRSAR